VDVNYHSTWHVPLVAMVTCTAADHVQNNNVGVRGECPAYFTDVCLPVETVAGRAKLRSALHGELIVQPTKTKTFGSRSVCSAVPTVWKSLPHHLRQSEISRGQFASGKNTFSCAYTYRRRY